MLLAKEKRKRLSECVGVRCVWICINLVYRFSKWSRKAFKERAAASSAK